MSAMSIERSFHNSYWSNLAAWGLNGCSAHIPDFDVIYLLTEIKPIVVIRVLVP